MANVQVNAAGVLRIKGMAREVREAIAEDVATSARRRVPVDTETLKDTIRVKHEADESLVIVGTEYWASVEYGSKPHKIRSTGPWPLRNKEFGEVYGQEVNHPGTPEQAFMRPALYQKRTLHRKKVKGK